MLYESIAQNPKPLNDKGLRDHHHSTRQPSPQLGAKPTPDAPDALAAGAEAAAGPSPQPGPVAGPRLDPALARLIDAWPTLPPAIKAGIAAMIGAAMPAKGDA